MPDTVTDRINKLDGNKPNQFIFTYRRGFSIGDTEITGEDRDTDDSKEKQATHDSSYEFHATKYTEEEPVIPD